MSWNSSSPRQKRFPSHSTSAGLGKGFHLAEHDPSDIKTGTQPTQDSAFSFSLAMVANSDANAHVNGHAQLFLSLGQISTSLLW